MVSKTINVGVEGGLAVGIARQMADLSEKYHCSAWLKYNDADVNMGSLLNIVAMGITEGAQVTVCCSGPDEERALTAYVELLE